jgi:hypothetical protein
MFVVVSTACAVAADHAENSTNSSFISLDKEDANIARASLRGATFSLNGRDKAVQQHSAWSNGDTAAESNMLASRAVAQVYGSRPVFALPAFGEVNHPTAEVRGGLELVGDHWKLMATSGWGNLTDAEAMRLFNVSVLGPVDPKFIPTSVPGDNTEAFNFKAAFWQKQEWGKTKCIIAMRGLTTAPEIALFTKDLKNQCQTSNFPAVLGTNWTLPRALKQASVIPCFYAGYVYARQQYLKDFAPLIGQCHSIILSGHSMGGGNAQYLFDDMTDPETPLFGSSTKIAPIELVLWAAVGPTVKDSVPLRRGDAATMVLVANLRNDTWDGLHNATKAAEEPQEDVIPHFFKPFKLTQIVSDQERWLRRERCAPIEEIDCFAERYQKALPTLSAAIMQDVCVYHQMFFLYEDDCAANPRANKHNPFLYPKGAKGGAAPA